jgi:hypothetical protein
MLYLDDDECYLELVLPSQSVPVEKARRLSHKTYCAINLESNQATSRVIGELDIDPIQEEILVPELRIKIEEECEEYLVRLRHQGLDDAVIAEWRCDGFPTSNPYLLFNSETKKIINNELLNGSKLSFLYRRNCDIVLSDGIESESEDPISVSRLGGWRLLELAKTSPLEKLETISLANFTGEKLEIFWVDTGDGNSNRKPLIKGLGLPGQANRFIMLAESPELWLPPAVTDAQIEMFKIEDDETYMPLGTIQVPSTEGWQQTEVRKHITCPGLYSVKLSYFEDSSDRLRKWSRQILIAEQPDKKSLHPRSLQAEYRFKEIMRVVDLEKNVYPMALKESQEFWNADWLIHGLWAHEKIRVHLDGDGEKYSPVLSADNSGRCNIPISAFEPYLLSRESAKLSIQRQGFICQYDLAVLIRSPGLGDQEIREEQGQSITQLGRRSVQRRRIIDTVDLVVNGDRSYEIQRRIAVKFDDLIKEYLGHLETWPIEYPDGKKAPGRRFVFHKLSIADIENDTKEKLSLELDSLLSSMGNEFGFVFSAEWSRARK